MKKMRNIAIISAIIIGLTATSAAGTVNINNGIDVEVDYWIGLVTPVIDLENQSVIINANLGENETYYVNDTIEIDINLTDNTGRDNYILPRSMFYSILVVRQAEITFGFDILSRMFPVRSFGSINVVDSMLGNNITDKITLPLDYKISNTTYDDGEEMTMHIMVMGFLPGDTCDDPCRPPIIDYRKITLNATYV